MCVVCVCGWGVWECGCVCGCVGVGVGVGVVRADVTGHEKKTKQNTQTNDKAIKTGNRT